MDIQAYKEAVGFMKNFRKENPAHNNDISNLYVIRRIDKEGNVLDTKFGMNLMTDYGFHRHFISSYTWPTRVYVGDGIPYGSDHFSQDSQTLENIISTTYLTVSNSTRDYKCPFYYDSASSSSEQGGLITVFCQYLVCYMDYQNSTYGISDQSKLIYEFGLGDTATQLWTHSRVYTSAGVPSHVTKNNGERLEFTIFLCLSYYESLIMNGWDDSGHVQGKYGTYTVITTPERMFNKMEPANSNSIYTFQRNDRNNKSIGYTTTSTAIEETYITKTNLINSTTLETTAGDGKITSGNGYVDGFINDSPGMCIVEREEMDHLEDIRLVMHPSSPYENGMSDAFGERDWYRFTQFQDITKVAMFDYTTDDWDNNSQYVNDARKWYDETPLMTTFGKPIYYMSNNTVQTLYVHQNINQLDGITAITSGNLIVYMASKYWDTSTWVNIQDLLHIPAAYKHYKYILTADNSTALTVERELTNFKFVPNAGTGDRTYGFTKQQGFHLSIDNYAFGWYKADTTVYVPDNLKTYTTSSNFSMTWDKWLVNYNQNSTLTAYDMTNVVSLNPSSLTSYTITPAFGSTVSNIVSACYKTDSGTGLICLFDKSHSQAVVIDLTSFNGSTFTTNELISNCIMACCIGNTRKVAYIPSNATNTIVIYDYTTQQVYTTLTVPSMSSVVTILIGLNDHVWISNNSAANTYYININTGSYDLCNTAIPWGSNATLGNFTCSFTNNFFVGYNRIETMSSHNQAFVVREDRPAEVISLANLKIDKSGFSSLSITLRNVTTSTSSNTCAMIISSQYSDGNTGCTNIIKDLGYHYFNEDNSVGLDNYCVDSYTRNTNGTTIPFGQFLMVDNRIQTPLEYAMPHYVIGKTRTITAQNGFKNISGKSWSTTFTNTPKFYGLPPGTMATIER